MLIKALYTLFIMFRISNLDIHFGIPHENFSHKIVVKLEYFRTSNMTSLFKRFAEPIHSNQSTCRPE